MFKNTYWGNFEYNGSNLKNEIIVNRNKFIKDYGIRRKIKNKNVPKYVKKSYCDGNFLKDMDHIEVYETFVNNYLIVNSPYRFDDYEPIFLNDNGWYEIYKLYSSDARTFIKIISKRTKKMI